MREDRAGCHKYWTQETLGMRILGFIIPFLFLLLATTVAHAADLVCADCHTTSPHGTNCGTCSISCHTDKQDNTNHPVGAGTPMADLSTEAGKTAACVTCHIGPNTNMVHPFRINVDPNVTLAGYTDLDDACGQCHGSGTDRSAPVRPVTAFWISKSVLAAAANGMHSQTVNGSPVLPPNYGGTTSSGSITDDTFLTDDLTGTTSTIFTYHDSSSGGGDGILVQVYIDWGDGSPLSKIDIGGDALHQYRNSGVYPISIMVQDNLGFMDVKKYEITVTDSAPNQYGQYTVTARSCATNVALANVNVYLTQGTLQFHGATATTGTVTLPLVANTMPAGQYALKIYCPAGKIPQSDGGCTTAFINGTSVAVPGSISIWCR